QAIGEHLRKSACVDTSLHLGHVIRRTIEGDGPGVGVEHGVRRPRIAVAWLPDTTGVDERPLFEAVRLARRDARRFRAVRGEMKKGRDVRVPVAAVIGLGELKRGPCRARRRHVFPERIAETAVAQREAVGRHDGRQRAERVALLGREPPLMQERRLGRAIVEELEALAGRDGAVVVALNEQRASLPQERKRVAWVRSVSDGVTGHPQRLDLPERSEDRLERDEVRVDVGKEPYPHAALASASVKRPSRNARPITTDAAPQRASARTSSTSRTPPPVWMAVSAPIFDRRRSMRTSGGPPRRPSALVSTTYSARIPRSAAISAASAASRPDARRTRSASPPRGASAPRAASISTIARSPRRAMRRSRVSSPNTALENSTPANPAAIASSAFASEEMPPARRQGTPAVR